MAENIVLDLREWAGWPSISVTGQTLSFQGKDQEGRQVHVVVALTHDQNRAIANKSPSRPIGSWRTSRTQLTWRSQQEPQQEPTRSRRTI